MSKTNATATTATESREVAKEAPKTFADLIKSDGYKDQIQKALANGIKADHMIRCVLTAINRTPKLLQCTKESLWLAVLNCSALGLVPDPLGRAYMVPFGTECTLIVGYRGLIDLAYRSGQIDSIQVHSVHEGDTFAYSYGTKPSIEHTPGKKRGPLTYVYSIVHLKGAAMPSFDVMDRSDVDAIRARSRASGSGPWVTDYNEMAKKTVLRRHFKILPMATEDISRALAMDHEDTDLGDVATGAEARLKDDFGNAKPAEVVGSGEPQPSILLRDTIEKA